MGAITRGIANNILGNGAVDGTDALTGTIPATNIGNPSLANLTTFPPSVDAGIPQVAGDPPAPSDGDVWYNTNTYKLRVRGLAAATGTWATAPSMNTARRGLAGAGTRTAALSFGSYPPPSPTAALTESYNGTSWTEVNDMNTQRGNHMGAGTQTSAIASAGYTNIADAETWNGTSWTEVNNLNQGRYYVAGFGADNTSAITTGGEYPGTNATGATESWNGTSWTEVNNLNTARANSSGTGTSTSGLIASGYNGTTAVGNTETWNGTSWTEVADVNLARNNYGIFGSDSTQAIMNGRYAPTITNTEYWNGTSWTEVNDNTKDRGLHTGHGSATQGLISGGYNTGDTSNIADVEEWIGGAGNQDVDLA